MKRKILAGILAVTWSVAGFSSAALAGGACCALKDKGNAQAAEAAPAEASGASSDGSL